MRIRKKKNDRCMRCGIAGAICAISLLLCGCALSRKHMNPNLTVPDERPEIGVMHRDEVLKKLGPPLKMTILPNGYAFMYEGLTAIELQLGFSLPIPYINWFKFVFAEADYDHIVLVYVFDREHRLIAMGGNDTHFDLGNSMAVQPVFTVQMLFDTTAIENEIVDLTEWPEFCLQPLPQTLNRANSMNVGVTGLEQRGTAPSVGQRATEMHR